MPTDDNIKDWIQRAESGDVHSARWLVDELAQCLYRNEPIPEMVRAYFAPRLAEIGQNPDADPLTELGLKARRGRPSEDWQEHLELVKAVANAVGLEGLSERAAFEKLASSFSLSEERVKTLFYANVEACMPFLCPQYHTYCETKKRWHQPD